MPKTIKFSVNTSIEIKEIEVKYPHIIQKILPELTRETFEWREENDYISATDWAMVTQFLGYLDKKYGKQ